jgi:hypothetical protein
MVADRIAECRARLLATLRLQYTDTLDKDGFRVLQPHTGEQYTDDRRHLVATCRSVANFALDATADYQEWCFDAAEHGLKFLRETHCVADGGDHLVVDGGGEPLDQTRSAYGHAFVLLAYALAATIFTALAFGAYLLGAALGFGLPLATLLVISLVSGMSVAVIAVIFSFAATWASYRMGIDPDDTTIPIVTNIVDVFGMVIFIGVSAFVLGF